MKSSLSLLLLTLLSLSVSFTLTSANEEAELEKVIKPHKTFKVYHSFGQNKPFVPRGRVNFTIDSGDGGIVVEIENDDSCLGASTLEEMDALISDGGFYKIKIVDEEGSDVTGNSVMASVPGCEVKRANFREEIALSMSQTGSLLSLSYTPLVSPLAAQCHELEPMSTSNREYKFKTLISYSTSTPGMTLPKILPKMRPPAGLNAIKITKSASEGSGGNDNNINHQQQQQNYGGANRFHAEEDEEKRNQQANQSFLRKYWYIILPLSIMTFLGSDEETTKQMQQQRQQQQQSQSQQQRQRVENTTAVASSAPGGGNAPRQRRGKRG